MLTLNNLTKTLKYFSDNHGMLKSFYFNDPWDEQSGGQSIKYPMMFAVLEPSIIGENIDKTVFKIYISDRVKKGERNEVEVLSDTKLICKDLLVYLAYTRFSDIVVIKKDVTLNNFTQSFDDELSGWWFDLEIKTKFDWNLCSIPVTGTPPIYNPTNVSIIDSVTGLTIASVPAGGVYTVEQLQEIIDTITANTTTIIDPLT